MRIVQAPEKYTLKEGEFALFLAGSTQPHHDWRSELIEPLMQKYKDAPVVLLNPYREDYPKKVNELEVQNEWECDAIQRANGAIFWLCDDTIAPLSLLELGLFLEGTRPIFFGMNPAYKLSLDIRERIRIFKPNVSVKSSVQELQRELSNYIEMQFSTGNMKKASRVRLSKRRIRTRQ